MADDGNSNNSRLMIYGAVGLVILLAFVFILKRTGDLQSEVDTLKKRNEEIEKLLNSQGRLLMGHEAFLRGEPQKTPKKKTRRNQSGSHRSQPNRPGPAAVATAASDEDEEDIDAALQSELESQCEGEDGECQLELDTTDDNDNEVE